MKINEVEAQVGITKKNIRFYEEQGLIAPRRNSENGYREYGPREVDQLRQVKLLRKLGVPLEEIRKMQSGTHTVGDGMRRHLVTLERDKKNLEQSIQLCRTLSDRNERLDDLDAAALLEQMDRLEREGTTFLNKQVEDTKRLRYIAPAVVTVLTVALMAGLMALMIWGFTIDAEEAPPLPLVVVLVAIPGVIILGVLLALIQRVQEIEKGEVDDAKKYEGPRPGHCRGVGNRCGGAAVFRLPSLGHAGGGTHPRCHRDHGRVRPAGRGHCSGCAVRHGAASAGDSRRRGR